MPLVSVDGTYRDGRVELSECPEGLEGPVPVIVTFLRPADRPSATPDTRGAPRRVGGQLRGQIWIAEDFDAIPEEIAEAFGIDGP